MVQAQYMRGAVYESAGTPAKAVDNLPVPKPGPDQVLVKPLWLAINPV